MSEIRNRMKQAMKSHFYSASEAKECAKLVFKNFTENWKEALIKTHSSCFKSETGAILMYTNLIEIAKPFNLEACLCNYIPVESTLCLRKRATKPDLVIYVHIYISNDDIRLLRTTCFLFDKQLYLPSVEQTVAYFKSKYNVPSDVLKNIVINGYGTDGILRNYRDIIYCDVDETMDHLNMLRTCVSCDRFGPYFMVCSGCKKPYYCSRDCQVKDWKLSHKFTCLNEKK
jgi:hypothetical protein